MRSPIPIVGARFAIASALLASIACDSPATRSTAIVEPVPAKVTLDVAPAATSFVVGTAGSVQARAFDHAGVEMTWTAPRRIEASDSSVIRVNADGSVLAQRVGTTWLRLTWAGRVLVRDSVLVNVGVRSVGTVRFFTFEGGCWLIVTDARTAYEPTNLPGAFKVDGLRVHIAARPSRFDGSFCMAGTLIDLDSIRIEAQ